MKNCENWRPSKFILKNGRLAASRDKKQIGVGSRLIGNIVAGYYGEYLPRYARGRLLDLGCGHVPLFQAYKEYVSDIVCVDWENTLHENEFLDFTCDLNEKLPFGDNEFDTIVLSDVLEHIHSPKLLWKEMARILAKDGAIILNVPFYYMLHEAPHDYYRYTEFALKRFIEEEKLRLVFFEPTGGLLEVMGDIHSKALSQFGFIGEWAADIVQKGTRLIRKTWLGEKIYCKTKDVFPLGYFLVVKK